MNVLVLLAQADGFAPMTSESRERLIVLGAVATVVVGVLFWLLVIRVKPPRRPGQPRQRRPVRSVARSLTAGLADVKRVLRARQRREPAALARRNPTLAEARRPLPRRSDDSSSPANAPPDK